MFTRPCCWQRGEGKEILHSWVRTSVPYTIVALCV